MAIGKAVLPLIKGAGKAKGLTLEDVPKLTENVKAEPLDFGAGIAEANAKAKEARAPLNPTDTETPKPDVDVSDRLMFMHNTDGEKLARQEAQGGMAMPSLAVTKGNIPFEGYGDITMIGKKQKFDPKTTKLNEIFSADAYTVRSPRPVRVAKKGAGKRFQSGIGERINLKGQYADEVSSHIWDLQIKGDANPSQYEAVYNFFSRGSQTDEVFLEDIGVPVPKEVKAYDIARQYPEERIKWAKQQMDEIFQPEEYFVANPNRDYYSSKAKLKPYNAEELTKFMKRSSGRGGEGGMATSSVGGVRASTTEQLTSLKQMRDRKGMLVSSEDMAEFKVTTESLYFDLAEAAKPYYEYDASGFRYFDEFAELLQMSERRGMDEAAKEIGFKFPDEFKQELTEYKDMLRSGLTEYFEAKPKRVVGLDEFEGAIVPENVSQDTLDLLERNGVKVEKYADEADRTRKRSTFGTEAFSITPLAIAGLGGYSVLRSEDAEAIPIAKAGKIVIQGWHGTPHKVDKFSTDKIGTGEGAQAYGHGLYFADRRGISEDYQKKLSAGKGGIQYKGDNLREGELKYSDKRALNAALSDIEALYKNTLDIKGAVDIKIEQYKSAISSWQMDGKPSRSSAHGKIYFEDILSELEGLDIDEVKMADGGNLYEVEIDASPDELLDWDKPLSEQSEKVKDALAEYKKDLDDVIKANKSIIDDLVAKVKGEGRRPTDKEKMRVNDAQQLLTRYRYDDGNLYQKLERFYGAGAQSSEFLKSKGIKGIQYLDGVSRNKPIKDIIREFQQELPDDADFDEVMDMVHNGGFSHEKANVIRGLEESDWLGFEYPSQAISAAYSKDFMSFDPSQRLIDAIEASKPQDATKNYVIFDDSLITILNENDVPVKLDLKVSNAD